MHFFDRKLLREGFIYLFMLQRVKSYTLLALTFVGESMRTIFHNLLSIVNMCAVCIYCRMHYLSCEYDALVPLLLTFHIF